MNIKRIIVVLMLITATLLFTACWDKIELEEEGYVAAVGIDKGENNKISITFQISNPKAAAGTKSGGGGNEPKSDIITFDTVGPITARDLSTISVTRRIDLAHAKIIIIGEEFARTERFFHILEAALRDKQLRRSLNIMVTKERASEFIKANQPILEDRPQKFYEFMATRWSETGLVPPMSNLNRLMQRTEQGESLFLAIYGSTRKYPTKHAENEAAYLPGQLDMKTDNEAEIIGSAVFKNGVMVGTLSGDETRINSFLREKPEFENMVVSFPDPLDDKFRIEGRVTKKKRTKIDLDIKTEPSNINVEVPISIEILSIPSFKNYVDDVKNQKLLKKNIENYLEEKSMALIRKTQIQFKGEPFRWELEARKKFLTYDDYKNYGWMKKYPRAKVTVRYHVTLVGFGKQLSPPKFSPGVDEDT